jgi:hypothetical protein
MKLLAFYSHSTAVMSKRLQCRPHRKSRKGIQKTFLNHHDHLSNSSLKGILIALAHTLISADLLVLSCALLHKCLQLCIIVLCDSLWLHLDNTASSIRLNILADVDNGCLESSNSEVLLQTRAGKDV